ncbi:DNA polymerase III subunit theta [Brenneria corticis]|uniref:DNA polymerase III subunit theta n=1 Tax=Brenneria corticis TaxID=2173106 RepID=A0A2U1TM54_9GAMM|nr:DNA polymerase III subunit theta [Brenneria sp. CFCC 11842]PWC10504.1 DNA polymerase III subunit theta [Brenneria sp. CFCC 11842]
MSYNLGDLPQEERDKVNIDIAASGVAYKERMNMPVIPAQIESEQPEKYREYFRERLAYYRGVSKTLPNANDPRYQQMADVNGKK